MSKTALFYQEDLGVSELAAERVAKFMEVSATVHAVVNPRVWASDDGNVCRVYFKQWSQNSKPAIHFLDKAYYDAAEDDVFYEADYLGKMTLERAARLRREYYSGAKTRASIEEFAEVFYEQKSSRD